MRTTTGGFLLDQDYFVNAWTGCTHTSPADLTVVFCAAPISTVEIDLGNGDDYLDYYPTGAFATTFMAVSAGPR